MDTYLFIQVEIKIVYIPICLAVRTCVLEREYVCVRESKYVCRVCVGVGECLPGKCGYCLKPEEFFLAFFVFLVLVGA